jgi:anti-anti-sigma regulatory factor
VSTEPTAAPQDGPGACFDAGAEFTIAHVQALRLQWLAQLEQCASTVRADLSRVEAMDSAGVQLLAALAASAGARGLAWGAVPASAPAREALATCGLDALLEAAP